MDSVVRKAIKACQYLMHADVLLLLSGSRGIRSPRPGTIAATVHVGSLNDAAGKSGDSKLGMISKNDNNS